MDNNKNNHQETKPNGPMKPNNNSRSKARKKKKKKNILLMIIGGIIRTFLILILLIMMGGTVFMGAVGGGVIKILQAAPDIDPSLINSSLDQTTMIYDQNGVLIEKVQAVELRTSVGIDQMPENLKKAFIAIEDDRFLTHHGVDPIGIASSMLDNVRAGGLIRGASTITQQLVRNVYLSSEKKMQRKITEAYLALQIEKAMTKDQILEAYLNRISLGQNAYGVQEAAQTYFSKDVKDLNLAESALLAGIPRNPAKFSPYHKVRPEDFDSNTMFEIGRVEVVGEKYVAVFNPTSVERQKVVLRRMYELGRITYEEYMSALEVDIKLALKPNNRKIEGISSYFTDFVKTQAAEELQKKLDITKEEAQDMISHGGLKIYATIDLSMQKKLEEVYRNFTEVLVGPTDKIKGPILINWSLDKAGNIIDENGGLIYYKKGNIISEDNQLVINNGQFEKTDEGIFIQSKKLTPYQKHIDITDYYTIDGKKNLVTHTLGSIVIPHGQFSVDKKRKIFISSEFLRNNPDFYQLDSSGNMLISDKFFYHSSQGIVQPQSTCVVMDYHGHIKALIGGRDIEGARILNRATASQRQPGSAIKPLSVYLPALDNGYTAASVIDDTPLSTEENKVWPRNFYTGYKGLVTLRQAVVKSINTCSAKTLKDVGIDTSIQYLSKMGIIDPLNPQDDNFISRHENKVTNDENLAALGLGGMTRGITPLNMTAAFATIGNEGRYIPPISFTKIADAKDNIIIDNTPQEVTVVSPQTAYIMKDILRSVVYDGFNKKAIFGDIVVAGKTGTTQNRADIWFVGMTPYYISSVWIGNDAPKIMLNTSSPKATELWGYINKKIHEGLPAVAEFNKPDKIVKASVCAQSGHKPSELCSRDPRGSMIISEIFVEGTVPKELCASHVTVKVCKVSGLPASDFCPAGDVVDKICIQRPIPYDPTQHGNNVPADYDYRVPNGSCNVHTELDNIFQDLLNQESGNPITPQISVPPVPNAPPMYETPETPTLPEEGEGF